MMAGPRMLSEEERVLWVEVARTATPLKGRAPLLLSGPVPEAAADHHKAAPPQAPPRPSRPGPHPHPHAFDRQTLRKLERERLPIEARIDLHGMTQAEAHNFLLSFLHQAHARGLRHVLIVTGKGSSFGSDGALRRAVPLWLSTGPFRAVVAGQDEAARRHGGSGALYVRLRRRPGDDP